jgi:hypothetical protein
MATHHSRIPPFVSRRLGNAYNQVGHITSCVSSAALAVRLRRGARERPWQYGTPFRGMI